jgi:hypothetical protein
MSVGVGREERSAEVHCHRLLQNRGAFAPPIRAQRLDFFVGRNRDRQFSGVGGAS